MTKISIDNKEYELDSLSDKAKSNVASLRYVQSELQRNNAQIAVLKTAEVAYTNALKNELSED